jgi:stalled ribosome alternative rescue factor ArfA
MGGPKPPEQKKKPKVEPKMKMKGLQWTKLPPFKVKGTVFEKFSENYSGSVKIDYSQVEELFAQKVIEKKEQGKASVKKKKKRERKKKTSIFPHLFFFSLVIIGRTKDCASVGLKTVAELVYFLVSIQGFVLC